MFMWVLGRYGGSTVLLVPKDLLEGADRIGGQLHVEKECLFSGITSSGRVWWQVPESDAGSVTQPPTPSSSWCYHYRYPCFTPIFRF